MYCIDCNKLICSKCLIQCHKNHNLVFYEDYLNECKDRKEEAMNLVKMHRDKNNKLKLQISLDKKKA